MKVTGSSLALIALSLAATVASAATIDMDNPHRALGREGDVRVDAQLARDTVVPGTPVAITYQVHNLSAVPVAIADRATDASYDDDSRTIIVGIGSEVPPDGNMPRMTVIAPGEKRVFTTAVTPALRAVAMRATMAIVPRFVQMKVAILRDVAPYQDLIARDSRQRLSDGLFDQWFESNDTIFLNAIPVRYEPPPVSEIERRHGSR
jgi:hypothetical protein